MRRRKDGLCHRCNEPGMTVDGHCQSHADQGRRLYEEDLAKTPVYAATRKPRPAWDELSPAAKNAWSTKAKLDA